MSLQIGIDVGGTFTDIVVFDARSKYLEFFKVPTTHSPDQGVIQGLREIELSLGLSLQDIARLVHGTTAATNALLERRWAKTALITTEGFRDVLEIGRQDRSSLYDWDLDRPEPMVSRALRLEVPERVAADGTIVRKLDEHRVMELIPRLRDVEAIAVCFLFSYLNPEHERRVKTLLERELDVPIALSSEVLPEYREYERTSTTVMSAALRPVVGDYLGRLTHQIAQLGIGAPLEIMQSNGGLVGAEIAARHAESLLYSGPAGGAAGAQFIGERVGFSNLIALDMGGTSCDVSLIVEGRVQQRVESALAGYKVRVPMTDIHSVGAGGGSVAWIDAGGALRVGPQSAGSDPGPVCCGRGEEPTVTDAHLVLGRFDPANALGGRRLDLIRAAQAIRERVAEPLGMSVEDAALGILEVANAHMERAIRVVSVERGYDPQDHVLLAFGGAGPLHAAALAERLNIGRVLVPAGAGVLSALGMLTTDQRQDGVQSLMRPTTDVGPGRIARIFQLLRREAEAGLRTDRISDVVHRAWIELRYRGQAYEIALELPETIWNGAFTRDELRDLEMRFHEEHRRLYGYAMERHPTEIVNLRLEALGKTTKPELPRWEPAGERPLKRTTRTVRFPEKGTLECAILAREELPPGCELEGPAIIEGRDSTVAVPPGWQANVDAFGNLILAAR